MSGPSLYVRPDPLTFLPINHIYYTRQGHLFQSSKYTGWVLSPSYRRSRTPCATAAFQIMSLLTLTVGQCFYQRIYLRENSVLLLFGSLGVRRIVLQFAYSFSTQKCVVIYAIVACSGYLLEASPKKLSRKDFWFGFICIFSGAVVKT